MTETLSLSEYQTALKGKSVTLGWDVIVCYTAKELNTLLGTQWLTAGTTSVQIEKQYPDLGLQRHYDLRLGTPSLQFAANASGIAQLKCSIDGTYRKDTIDEECNVIEIGKEVNTIPTSAYVLDIEVPILAVHADGTPGDDPKSIRFQSDKEAESYIIFHFENAGDTNFKVSKIDTEKHKEDKVITDISGRNGELSAWFSTRNNLDWINVAIAQVRNKKASADGTDKISDLLRPKSFYFTTQSNADGGVLLIFMQTEGSGSQPGNSDPHFNAPSRSTENVSAIPSGSHAAIIINHDLFLKKFLRDQLSSKWTTAVTAVDTKEGFKLNCPLARIQNEFKRSDRSWYSRFDVGGMEIDFSKDLLSLAIEDDAQLTTTAAWSFNKTAAINWNVSDANHSEYGQVDITITVDQRSPAIAVLPNSIQIKIDLGASAFKCNMKAHEYPWWSKAFSGAKEYLPNDIQGMRFTFQDISLTLPELDFFATQNVFVPGQQAILAKRTISPYDFVVLGDIASPANMLPPVQNHKLISLPANHQKQHVAWNRLRAPLIKYHLAKVRSLRSAPDVDRMKAMYNALYTDDFGFAHDFIAGLTSGDQSVFEGALSKRGYDLSSVDAGCMDSLTVPGPDFDLRFVGGAYKFNAGETESIIFVSPKTRVLYLDWSPVMDQKIDQSGTVTFTDPEQKCIYSGSFTRTYNDDGEVGKDQFCGARWPVDNPASKEDVTANRHYLLGNNRLKSIQKPRKPGTGLKGGSEGGDWTESPAMNNLASLLTAYAGLELGFRLLKRCWQAKQLWPRMVEKGQKLGLLRKDTEPIIIEKMKKEIEVKTINKRALSSVDIDIRRAFVKEMGIKDMSDKATSKAVMDAVAEKARARTVEGIMAQIQGEEISAHSVVVAIGASAEFMDAMEKACEKKFGDIMVRAQWEVYLGSLLDTCIAEQKVTEAGFDVKKITQEVEAAKRKMKEVADARRKFDEKLAAERQKIKDDFPEEERAQRLAELKEKMEAEAESITKAEQDAANEFADAEKSKTELEKEFDKWQTERDEKVKESDTRRNEAFS
ncbi:hypothetical protein K458DRAFT_400132 [Lentithecium fluviatile CBS 122367]|uniref:Uncharacterized protein n=1 Tax=Lentithecium fluviatile CBS 122367 TaxID=1168545 RepID=A0A6G1JGV4_9PLEO|nr:hypothetical protein K458DRAFT_400132 [Lentithecium fluviatile CBS 122367]